MQLKITNELKKYENILSEKEYLHLIANTILLNVIYLNKQSKVNYTVIINNLFSQLSLSNQNKLMNDITFIFDTYYNKINNDSINNAKIMDVVIDRATSSNNAEPIVKQDAHDPNLFNMSKIREINFNPFKINLPKLKKYISASDSLRFVSATFTETGLNLMHDKNTDANIKYFLETFNEHHSIMEIHNRYYPNISLTKLFEHIINFYDQGYLVFAPSRETPKNSEYSIRLGDLLIFLGFITQENLIKVIDIQKGKSKMLGLQNGSIVTVKTFPEEELHLKRRRILIGDLMLDLKVITKTALDYAIRIQKVLNSILYHG